MVSRTTRYDNGLNKERDDKPFGAKHESTSKHPKGYDSNLDDHGYYGAGGSKKMKKLSSSAQRLYHKNYLKGELDDNT